MAGLFISYRRDESRHAAGRLADDLVDAFGADSIFRDIEGIEPGVDFKQALDKALGSCVVMLVLIGPRWLDMADAHGVRRLDQPGDWIRMEIATALARDTRVIPVLLEGATLPEEDQLPEDMRPLVRRQAFELADGRWRGDLQRLVDALARVPGLERKRSPEPPPPPPVRKSRFKKVLIGVVISVAVLAVWIDSEVNDFTGDDSGYTYDAGNTGNDMGGEPYSDEEGSSGEDREQGDPVADFPNDDLPNDDLPGDDLPVAPPPPPAASIPDVSGLWRTYTGEVYHFEQNGLNVEFYAEAAGQQIGVGQGRFDGQMLRLAMTMYLNGLVMGVANCDMQAAPDGRSYTGMCNGPNGILPAQIFR